MRKHIFPIFIIVLLALPLSVQPASANVSLSWTKCTTCPEYPEVSISGNSISMGIANRTENSWQSNSKHGASAILPAASGYSITFDYSFFTWDSYNPTTQGWTGYWDSFSVSVSSSPYWQLPLSDPITNNNLPGLRFIWGGTQYADGKLERASGTKTVTFTGNPSGSNYINVMLDTATYPHSNHAFPSWGSVTIKEVKILGSSNEVPSELASAAANLARTVVRGPYLKGGKGWDMIEQRYVSADEIVNTGYNYWNALKTYDPVNDKYTGGISFGKGLDCSGLVLWSYNKANGNTQSWVSQGPIKYEGANEQYAYCTLAVDEASLRPGDLLFFDWDGNKIDHVAMYVGPVGDNDVVHASSPTAGIIWDKKSLLSNRSGFVGYGRVVNCTQGIVIHTRSPIHLVVIDPDGYTISPDLIQETEEEQLISIPGQLYYSVVDNEDDVVYSPVLKTGVYQIKVVPKANASDTDTYSIEVEGASKLVVLAQDVPISDIPQNGYTLVSTGDEIIPGGGINQSPTISVPEPQTVQYSDPLTFVISATDPDDANETLTFYASGLPSGLTLINNGDGTASVSGLVNTSPDIYYAELTVQDPEGFSHTGIVPITVSKEDTQVTYSGPMLVSTGCADCTTAVVPLRATIQDITAVIGDPLYDAYPGNITNATVSFVNRGNANEVLCTAAVHLLDPADIKTGTASCDWAVDIGGSDGIDYVIGTVVDGYYTRNSAEDDTLVVVSKPTTNFITGGGYLVNQSSAGTVAGDDDLKTNFGFNIKFTKKGTSLLGKATIIIRQDGRVYQIKTNVLSSLLVLPGTATTPATAELVAKASIEDVTDPLYPISIAGNATFSMVVKDYGEVGDTIAITVWGKDNSLLFSSNWNGVKTVEQLLGGGNLQIHLDK